MSTPAKPYLSNGQVLQAPPFSARARKFFDNSYNFCGLYITTLFSLDPASTAEQSPYNIRNRNRNKPASAVRAGPKPGSGSGGGGGGFGGGGGGRKVGRVDDIRGPECKSCG